MFNNKYASQGLNLLLWGILVGLALGGLKTLISLVKNNHLHYKLYNITLFELQYNLNEYLIISVLAILVLIFCYFILKTVINLFCSIAYKKTKRLNFDNLLISLKISLIVTTLLFAIAYSYYYELAFWSENISVLLKNILVPIKIRTYIFLLALFLLSTGILSIILMLFFSLLGIAQTAKTSFSKIINSRVSRASSLVLIVLLMIFNILILGYRGINSPEGPNIIVISIDTVRADHLQSYGYSRLTTPNMDRLARDGVLFENAFSQAPWTLPAMASIHTSLYPSEHGAVTVYSKMNDNFVTIAEILRNNFYKTIGVISQSFVSSQHGFDQGFEIFDEKYISGVDDISSEQITEQAIKYLEDNSSESFFLWVHYFDPHHSYIDHEEFKYGSEYSGSLPKILDLKELNNDKETLNTEDIEYVKDIYDEELSYTDKYIGDLIDSLNELGLEDDTVVIITADHGEEFMERTRFGHGKNLYQELIRVPLIVYVPGEQRLRGKTVKNNVELRSIPDTILELTGVENDLLGGVNLLTLSEQDRAPAISEGSYAWGEDSRKEGIISDNWKLIKNLDDNSYELYNLSTDPFEKQNLIEDYNNAYLVKDLKTELESIRKERTSVADKVKFNKEDIERLKALGYLQ